MTESVITTFQVLEILYFLAEKPINMRLMAIIIKDLMNEIEHQEKEKP